MGERTYMLTAVSPRVEWSMLLFPGGIPHIPNGSLEQHKRGESHLKERWVNCKKKKKKEMSWILAWVPNVDVSTLSQQEFDDVQLPRCSRTMQRRFIGSYLVSRKHPYTQECLRIDSRLLHFGYQSLQDFHISLFGCLLDHQMHGVLKLRIVGLLDSQISSCTIAQQHL